MQHFHDGFPTQKPPFTCSHGLYEGTMSRGDRFSMVGNLTLRSTGGFLRGPFACGMACIIL